MNNQPKLGLALGEYQALGTDEDAMRALVIGMPDPGALPQRGGLSRFHLNRLGLPVHKNLESLADHLVAKYYDAPTFWRE